MNRGRESEAEVLAQKAAEIDPDNLDVKALTTLGWVYHHLVTDAESQKLLQSVGTGGRMTSDAVYYYARIFESTDRKPEIRNLLEKALESDGRFVHRSQAKEWLDQLSADDQASEQPDQQVSERDEK